MIIHPLTRFAKVLGWEAQIYHSPIVGPFLRRTIIYNASTGLRRNLTRIDPTRTITLRRELQAEIARRYALLRLAIYDMIARGDALGLRPVMNAFCPTGKGGGIDPTCSPGKRLSNEKDRESWNIRKGGKWDAIFSAGIHKDNQGVLRDSPYSAELQAVSKRYFDLDPEIPEEKLALDLDGVLGEAPIEMTFENIHTGYGKEGNRFGVVGTGNAKEVIGKASNLMLGALDRFQPKFVYYTSAEKSRTQLYDFLTRRVETKNPNYQGLRLELPGVKDKSIFAIVRRDSLSKVSEYFNKHKVRFHEISKGKTATFNAKEWQFLRPFEKSKAFGAWIKSAIKRALGNDDDPIWRKFVTDAYTRGANRSFTDIRKTLGSERQRKLFYRETREQLLARYLSKSRALDSVDALTGRLARGMKAVMDELGAKLEYQLANALSRKLTPAQTAKILASQLGISMKRANVIARTELLRSFTEAQLDALEEEGFEDVDILVEWRTSGLNTPTSPCPICKPLEGVVLPIRKARGLLPRHPNCLCSYKPVTNREKNQKRTKRDIQAAVKRSIKAQRGKSGLGKVDQGILDLIDNAFCPTGEGGGIDNSCPSNRSPSATVIRDLLDGVSTGQTTTEKLNAALSGISKLPKPEIDALLKELKIYGKSPSKKDALDRIRAIITQQMDIEVKTKAFENMTFFPQNAFCPTGEGGGVDPHCAPGNKGTAKPIVKKGRSEQPTETSAPKSHAQRISGMVQKAEAAIERMQKEVDDVSKQADEIWKNYMLTTGKLKESQQAGKISMTEMIKKRDTLEADSMKVVTGAKEARKRLEQAKLKINHAIHQVIGPPQGERLSKTAIQTSGQNAVPDFKTATTEAHNFLSTVAHKDVAPKKGFSVDYAIGETGQRPAYSINKNTITMPIRVKADSAIHEWGHAIEDQNGAIGKAALEFLDRRVGKEKPIKLSEKFPERGYDDHETGREDNFGKVFGKSAHYVGKDYKGNASEIMAMGMEKLYENPIHFAKNDPEYFDFVVDALHGKFNRQPTGNVFCATGKGGGIDPTCSLSFSDEVRGAHSGQTDSTLTARTPDKKLAARLDYSVVDKKPLIQMVESTQKGLRAGEALVDRLAKEYGYEKIEWGSMTPDGVKLRERLDKKYGVERGTEKLDPKKLVSDAGGKLLSTDGRNFYSEFDTVKAGGQFAAQLKKMGAKVGFQRHGNKSWVDATMDLEKDYVRKIK